MLSLLRKISSSQSRNPSRKSTDDEFNADETRQGQEEVDGTTYDPDTDPRDPERYYTFPHFAEEKQENSGDVDDENQVNDESAKEAPMTPQTTPKINPKTTPSSAEPVSPPFWPISPIPKRMHSGKSPSPSKPAMQRRATTNFTPSPHLPVREKPARRASTQVQRGQHTPSPDKVHSAPRAPVQEKEVQSPTRESKLQRNVSARTQK